MEHTVGSGNINATQYAGFVTGRATSLRHEPPTSSTGGVTFTERPLVAISDTEVRARVQWGNLPSRHFNVYYDRICYHEKEAATLAVMLDDAYRAVFAMTHEGFFDRVPVYLCDLRSPSLLGRKAATHFNVGERSVYIVRSMTLSAEAELIPMVVHATRFHRYLKHYGITPGWAMLEDAYATFVAERIAHHRLTHPFFGAEPDVIAHHVIARSFLPSLSYAWQSVRFSSDLERRVLAGAFLVYLGDTASDDRVTTFSKCDDDVTSTTFRAYFGKSLEQLEAAWHEHLPKALMSYTDDERNDMLGHWNSIMSRLQG
ncbi:MAG: hypothetical protein JSS75_14485 [Bacteroidetes bacterium]|nr:hypothetical protein [Bacteroidota bacterium]